CSSADSPKASGADSRACSLSFQSASASRSVNRRISISPEYPRHDSRRRCWGYNVGHEMKMRGIRAALVMTGLLGLAAVAFSQRFGGGFGGGGFPSVPPDSEFPANAEFHFLRMEYTDAGGNRGFGFGSRRGRASGWWGQDWPDADEHFTKGVQRLTRMDAGNPQHVSLRDDKIFDYPWIYATQTGYWELSDEE